MKTELVAHHRPKAARRGTPWSRIRKGWQLYVMLALPVLFIVIFSYVPMYGAQIAFKDFVINKSIWGSEWVGLKHFNRFIHSYDFWRLLRNTISISMYSLLAGFPFPILLALSLNYVGKTWFKKSVQMITYAPYFISVVVMVGILFELLDPRKGIVNHAITALGFEPIQFLAKAEWFQSIYVWSGVWQLVGFSCIIYLAALASIDPALHEAAVIDGANKMRRIWHVDLPGIMPVAVILLIINMGHMLDVGYEKILLMQNSLNLSTSEVIDTYVYKVALNSPGMNYSYSTMIGLFKSVINLTLLIAVNGIARRLKQSSLW
ncbi:sugar ABC transporter permease [Paenibacillus agaridevorans]|uniref:Sugar ABC transporter permease n=1 Tax=Paenibacillus agaridevorans TaxID=171404 RepID=A0A2R5EU09_9BACL|nr:ABC transporter permease subunit [Paenibacillus agaridevorans]GBG10176.1 sugar ABC transporter permease [Paenibacillus agaridevorans]